MNPFDPIRLFELSFDDPMFRIMVAALLGLSVLAVVFVGIAVALRIRNERRLALRKRLDAQWKPLLLEVMSGERSPSDLYLRVPHRHRFYFTSFLYRFARRVRGQELATLRAAARPFLPEIHRSVKDGTPETRARRLQILGLLGFDAYADDVAAALDDPSPLVAMVAFRLLARPEHPDFLPLLLEKLSRFETFSHNLLASLLAGVGFEAAPLLRDVLRDAGRPAWVRAVAARALGLRNDVPSADVAATVLAEAHDPALLIAALDLLGRGGSERHRAAVRTHLRAPNAEVRLHAVRALGKIGGGEARELLEHALHDASPWVALAAAESLKQIGATELLRTMAASEHPRTDLFRQVLIENPVAA